MQTNIFELLQITIPSLILSVAIVSIIVIYQNNENKKRKHELLSQTRKTSIAIRLQAYERVLILLERLGFDSMLKRTYKKGMTVSELQQQLLTNIRTEFEHNFSQQLYMSNEAWQNVIISKENTIQIINTKSLGLKPDASGLELSKQIFEYLIEEARENPTKRAIDFLKKEAQQLF
jgi:hypothetical protein